MEKIAILILAHKYPHQLKRLVDSLNFEAFDFFIHIPQKTDITVFKKELPYQKIHWVERRIDTDLYDFSPVEATMSMLGDAISTDNYKYYIYLSGQDYPIKSNNEIYDCLMNSYPMDFIDMYGCEEGYEKGMTWVGDLGKKRFSQRFRRFLRKTVGENYLYSPKGRPVRAIAVAFDYFMTFVGESPRNAIKKTEYTYSAGSHLWILTDSSARFVYDRYLNDKTIIKIFRYAPVAGETFVQTILSAKKDIVIPDAYQQLLGPDYHMDGPNKHLIKWYENGKPTNGHPGIWKTEDIDYLLKARAFFARKFDEKIDSNVLDALDKFLKK